MMGLRQRRLVRLAALGAPLVVLVALLLLVTWGPGGGAKVAADAPHPGLDFSMGVDTNGDTTNDCSTGGGWNQPKPTQKTIEN